MPNITHLMPGQVTGGDQPDYSDITVDDRHIGVLAGLDLALDLN